MGMEAGWGGGGEWGGVVSLFFSPRKCSAKGCAAVAFCAGEQRRETDVKTCQALWNFPVRGPPAAHGHRETLDLEENLFECCLVLNPLHEGLLSCFLNV